MKKKNQKTGIIVAAVAALGFLAYKLFGSSNSTEQLNYTGNNGNSGNSTNNGANNWSGVVDTGLDVINNLINTFGNNSNSGQSSDELIYSEAYLNATPEEQMAFDKKLYENLIKTRQAHIDAGHDQAIINKFTRIINTIANKYGWATV